MIARHEFLTGILLGALAACAPGPAGHEADHETAPGAHDAHEASDATGAPTSALDIPATVRRNLGITFAEVEVRRVAQTLRIPGAFELEPRARREYRLALPGRVELLVDQYERVEPGAPLYRFQSPAWAELLHEVIEGEQAMETARAEIAVGRARLEEARRKLELARGRVEALAQADFKQAGLEAEAAALEAALPRLEAELGLAETRLANARRTRSHALHRAATASGIPEAELEVEVPGDESGGEPVPRYLAIDWIEVRAREAGVVEQLAVTDGAFVESPALVLSTADPARVRFRARALQADLARLAGVQRARIVPPAAPGAPPDPGVAATLTLGLEADPEQRTVALIATPEASAEWIRPGVSAFLEVVVAGTEAPALAVPRSAVVRDGLTHVVFRRDPADPNRALRVEADMGVSDGSWVVLNSGVMRGDEVVLAGAYELKLASQRGGARDEGGHVHADGSFHEDH